MRGERGGMAVAPLGSVLVVHESDNQQAGRVATSKSSILEVEVAYSCNGPNAVVGAGGTKLEATKTIVAAANESVAISRQSRKINDYAKREIESLLERSVDGAAFVTICANN
jgi:hypothetical protein